jgi:hypothetical protein
VSFLLAQSGNGKAQTIMMHRSTILMIAIQLASPTAGFAAGECGTGMDEWCPAPPGDPCGQYRNVSECKADAKCYGMPYRGVSFLPCVLDERGFGVNCPTVGCTSTPPKPVPPR